MLSASQEQRMHGTSQEQLLSGSAPDSHLSGTDNIRDVSTATKVVIGLLGLFFAAIVVWAVVRLIQLIATPFTRGVRKPKPRKAVPDHLTASVATEGSHRRQKQQVPQGRSVKTLLKQTKGRDTNHGADAGLQHPLYINSLKGHSGDITGLSWSPDAKLLATSCDDRTLRVFDLSDDICSSSVGFKRKSMTTGLTDVAFGRTGKELLVLTKGTLEAASLTMFNLDARGALNSSWQIPNAHEGAPALTVAGSSQGIFATCGQKTDMRVFSSTGKQLACLDAAGLTNHGIALSENGQFLAAATFTSDVKVHEMRFEKNGDFKCTAKVMDLKGHSRQVTAVAFRPDGKRAVTASNDHTLRIWNLDVRYLQQEDAKCLVNVQQELPADQSYTKLAFGAHGVIAAALERTLHMIDSASGAVLQIIEDAHNDIAYLQWSPQPRQIGDDSTFVLASGGDRRLRLWRSA